MAESFVIAKKAFIQGTETFNKPLINENKRVKRETRSAALYNFNSS